MYLIGGYIRLYDIKFFTKAKNRLDFSIIMITILFASIGIIYNIKQLLMPRAQELELTYLWTPNNIITLLLSISIFEFFAHLNIGSNKLINKIASTTLGIYMIHDGYLQKYLWNNILHTKDVLSSKYALLGIIVSVIIIFIFGIIIDLLRQLIEKYTVKRILNSVKVNNYMSKIRKKCENLLKYI